MERDDSTIEAATTAALAGAAQAAGSGDVAARAFALLAATLGEIEAGYVGSDRGGHSAEERAARRYLVANALQHGFQCWFEADPKRPLFHRWLSPTKKLLGDNPDAVYYGAIADPAGTYRIRGNVHGACYTSFSVETGAQEGHLSKGVVSTLNDGEFDVRADGSYEIIASPEPQPRNWLRLEPGAGSITTRHYWEWERSVAADPTFHVPLWIEPVDNPGPAAPMDDAALAAGIQRVVNFVRGATIDFPDIPADVMPAWVSRQVNRFSGSDAGQSNTDIGYAAKDNDYRQTVYELDADQALVMRGRFPRCRFANVVLWNHRLQTPPYRFRRVSLNRRQVRSESDGSFQIVVAHRDPGMPNWLDAAGLRTGMIFWRFLLPGEEVQPIEAEVVAVDSLK
jgi:hypothetical protein